MFVNVFSRFVMSEWDVDMNRWRMEGSLADLGVARTCWTFFAPASWVRTEGHLMAFDRSIWRRESQALESG